MTDNVSITAGSGTSVATDDIGGIQYQRVKVTWGSDGVANDTDTGTGAAFPIQIRNSTGTELATSGNPVRTDPTGTTAQPVTDNGGSLTVDNAGTFAVQSAPSLQTTSSLTNANVSISTSGENTVISGTASQTIRVFRGAFTAASAVTLTIKNAASGTTLATIPLSANGSVAFDTFESGEPLWITAPSGAFIVSLSSAVSVQGFIQYTKS